MKAPFSFSFSSFLLLSLTLAVHAQTYTAASANESDVNAVINGPTHVAVNGDTIQIPCSSPTSVTWSSSLKISANITLSALGASPNSSSSTFGAGNNCLTIIAASNNIIEFDPTYSSSNNVSTLQNITIVPGAGAYSPIHVYGTGTSSGMPQFRIDNIQFGTTGTPWSISNGNGEFLILANNAFGVIDHNTVPNNSQVVLVSVNLTAYLGVGQYGDNSWAQPDSMGGANNIFVENNLLNQGGWPVVENEYPFPNIGGGRAVTRFNQIIASNGATGGFFFVTGGHGLDTDGRDRAMRHNETYGNSITCAAGSTCYDICSYRGGTGLCWGNTVSLGSGAVWKEIAGLSTYRAIGDLDLNTNFGSCGDAAGGQAQGYFDLNDGTTYATGTITSGSGLSMTDASQNWTPNQWSNPSDHYPYSVWDITKGWTGSIVSNTANSLTIFSCDHGIIGGTGCSTYSFSSGDSYQIRRSKACLDGAARGQGALIQGYPAVLASTGAPGAANQVLDPIYEWDNTVPALNSGQIGGTSTNSVSPFAQANREYYTDNSLGSPQAQTSPSSPFNGSSGVGFGTLANRPATCTTGVGYFATDQGPWNSSGNGFGQGELFKCASTNTWALGYTPYTYPHPLVNGNATTASTPDAPTNLVSTVD